MFFELLVSLVVVSFDRSVLERPVHALNLPISPRMFRLRAAVFDRILLAGPGKSMNPEKDRPLLFGLFLDPGRFWRVVYKVRSIIGEHVLDSLMQLDTSKPCGKTDTNVKACSMQGLSDLKLPS